MRKIALLLIGLVIFLTGAILYFQQIHPYHVRVREHFIQSYHIPAAFNGARLLQLSDLNISTQRDVRLLKAAVEEANRLDPDMIVFTGNVFAIPLPNRQVIEETSQILGTLSADIGKVAVLGSSDLEEKEFITALLEDTGFHVLRNQSREFFNGNLAGISFIGLDPISAGNNPKNLLPQVSREGTFQILLTNEGHLASIAVDFDIDLQLSGFCLGNSTAAPACSQFFDGPYRFADQLFLNVSSGVGRSNDFFGFLKRPAVDSFLLIRQ